MRVLAYLLVGVVMLFLLSGCHRAVHHGGHHYSGHHFGHFGHYHGYHSYYH